MYAKRDKIFFQFLVLSFALFFLLFLLSAKHKVIFNISRQMIIRPLIWWTPFFVSYLSAVVLPFVWYLSEFFFFWLIPTTEQQWVVIRRNFAGLLSFFFNQWTALNSSHKHKNINKKLSEISKSPDRRTKNFNYNNNRWKRACATPTTKQLARQEKKRKKEVYLCQRLKR